MAEAVFSVHFREMEIDEELRSAVEGRCRHLSEEFPEIEHLEVTLSPEGAGHAATGHATGKRTEVATHATGIEPGRAVDQLLDKLRHSLRRIHDKKVSARRKSAQRSHPRRRPPHAGPRG